MRLVAALLAEGASIDAISNRLSIFNSYESVEAARFPALLPKMAVVSLYEREDREDDGTFLERVTIHAPGGEVVAVTSAVELTTSESAHRSLHFLPVNLAVAGEYMVRFWNARPEKEPHWIERAVRRLTVVEIQIAGEQPTPPDEALS